MYGNVKSSQSTCMVPAKAAAVEGSDVELILLCHNWLASWLHGVNSSSPRLSNVSLSRPPHGSWAGPHGQRVPPLEADCLSNNGTTPFQENWSYHSPCSIATLRVALINAPPVVNIYGTGPTAPSVGPVGASPPGPNLPPHPSLKLPTHGTNAMVGSHPRLSLSGEPSNSPRRRTSSHCTTDCLHSRDGTRPIDALDPHQPVRIATSALNFPQTPWSYQTPVFLMYCPQTLRRRCDCGCRCSDFTEAYCRPWKSPISAVSSKMPGQMRPILVPL